MRIHAIDNIPYEKLVFGKLKKGVDTYMMSTYLSENNALSKLCVQTPKLSLHSDLMVGDDIQPFVTYTSEDPSIAFFIKSTEDYVLTELKRNKEEWFVNKGIDDVFLENGLTSSVMKNNVYRFRIMKDVQVYDSSKSVVDISGIKKGVSSKCIIQMTGLWFTPSRWGVTWKVIQMKLQSKSPRIENREYMFTDDDNEDFNEDDSALTVPPNV
jgi:hypothetical protein|tara:strand:+ start:9898 stop:10533 length:636 start_codon:yes stop_codon:yes gene_type:complete